MGFVQGTVRILLGVNQNSTIEQDDVIAYDIVKYLKKEDNMSRIGEFCREIRAAEFCREIPKMPGMQIKKIHEEVRRLLEVENLTEKYGKETVDTLIGYFKSFPLDEDSEED